MAEINIIEKKQGGTFAKEILGRIRQGRCRLRALLGPQPFGFSQAVFAFVLITLFKFTLFPILTPDLTHYVLSWLQHVDVHGMSSLKDEFTDYAPGYTYVLLLASRIDTWVTPVSSIKLLSVLADCVMSMCGGLLVARIANDALRGAIAAIVLAALPTVVLNSAVWGQSDSIWTAAVLACIFAMSRTKPITAVLCLGLALAFKPQAIFLTPLLLGFLISCRAWPLLPLLSLPYTILALPMLIAGREAPSVFLVYLSQTMSPAEPPSSNAANLWAWLPVSSEPIVLLIGVGMASVAGLGLALASRRPDQLRGERLVIGAALCCILMPFLLPKMHDRYFYAGEALTAMLLCLRPALLSAFVGSQIAGLLCYQIFLLELPPWRAQLAAVLNLLVCALLLVAWRNRPSNTEAAQRCIQITGHSYAEPNQTNRCAIDLDEPYRS